MNQELHYKPTLLLLLLLPSHPMYCTTVGGGHYESYLMYRIEYTMYNTRHVQSGHC